MEIGIDCVDISEFEEVSKEKNLLSKIFTENEIQYCQKKSQSSQHFAVRFAGKEALIKALSNLDIKIPLNKIEILNKDDGTPYAKMLDKKYKSYEIKISLSHSKEVAVAMVTVTYNKDLIESDSKVIIMED